MNKKQKPQGNSGTLRRISLEAREREWKSEENEMYKRMIIELVEKIGNPVILMKIYTVVKTHYEILKEKKGAEG